MIANDKLTKAECVAKAQHWLDKALTLEAANEQRKMEMAFKAAVDTENDAFDGRS